MLDCQCLFAIIRWRVRLCFLYIYSRFQRFQRRVMAGQRNTFSRFQSAQPFWWIICVFGTSWATPTGRSYVAEPLNNLSRPDERRRLVLFRRSTLSSENTFIIFIIILLGIMCFLFALKLCRRRSFARGKQYKENG